MSRPLTGSITPNEGRRTFTASLPSGIPGKRRTATFDTKRDAEAWVAEGIRLLRAGHVVPPSRGPNPACPSVPSGTSFLAIAREHIRERYVEDGHGDVDREEQVTTHATAIDDYMTSQGLTVEAITRRDARAMWQHLLKDAPEPSDVELPEELKPAHLVTKRTALALLAEHGAPVSESTFKRAVAAGRLVAVDTSRSAHLFAIGDVFSPATGLARDSKGAGPPHRGRFSHSTLVDVRRLFRAVLEHAKADGVRVQSGVRGAKIPRDKAPKARARALTRREAARLATHLHAVHQLVLWLLVLLGLRVSEAYGILLDDVVDNGPGKHGIVTIQSQGGRRFKRRKKDGTVGSSDHIDETKGRRSDRVLVVPASLMDLIREVIVVFHVDELDNVRASARLVPGLRRQDVGGQSAFRNALNRAGAAEAIDITFDPASRSAGRAARVTPTPQKLRQSYATSHSAEQVAIEDIRTTLGQSLGESVIHTNYLIDDLGLGASRRIAEETEKHLRAELGGSLLIPTAVRCTTERQAALVGRAAEIDAQLLEKGWLVPGVPAGDWVTVSDAAAIVGVSEQQVREDIRAGKLAAISAPRTDQGGGRYLIPADDLSDYDAPGAPSDLTILADELDLPYDTVRHFVGRHPDLQLHRRPGERNGYLSREDAEHVRQHFQRQANLERRAVRLIDVARELGVSVAGIDTLIKRGDLVEDERFHGGYRSLTRSSLERWQSNRPRRGGQRRRDERSTERG